MSNKSENHNMFDIRKIQEQIIFSAIKEESDDTTAQRIVKADNETDPQWVLSTMQKLEDAFDSATARKIRMKCQCGYGMEEKLALLREIMSESSDIEEFGNNSKARATGLSYHNEAIFLQFPFCPCPMLAGVDKLNSLTWCQCTTGYSKVLFEKAFGCEVNVELLKSIKAGDDVCLMTIIPLGPVRF
jgi:hypothetical protein